MTEKEQQLRQQYLPGLHTAWRDLDREAEETKAELTAERDAELKAIFTESVWFISGAASVLGAYPASRLYFDYCLHPIPRLPSIATYFTFQLKHFCIYAHLPRFPHPVRRNCGASQVQRRPTAGLPG